MKELSIHLVANSDVQSRSGVEVKQVTREQWQTEANGLVETAAYEWSAPGAQRRMPFMLLLPRPPRFRFTVLRLLFESGGRRFARGGLCIAQVSASLPLRGWGGVILPD